MNRITSRTLPLFTIPLLVPRAALHAQEGERPRPDWCKVHPNMTEEIFQEASVIFTYVDEKRRRRLTLDFYRPENGEGKRG